MTNSDRMDEAFSRMAQDQPTLSDSFVESLEAKMKHQPSQSGGRKRMLALVAAVAVGVSSFSAVAYAATVYFLWDIPVVTISEDGALATVDGGVIDYYQDEQTGEYVTTMVTPDGQLVTMLSREDSQLKGMVFADPDTGEILPFDEVVPSDGILRLDRMILMDERRELIAPDGTKVILENGKPAED